MKAPQPLVIRGFLADGDTGAGLGGLRVELGPATRADGRPARPLAVTRSDDSGVFGLRFPFAAQDIGDNGHPSPLEVELRVLDRGRLLVSEVHDLRIADGLVRNEPLEIHVPHDVAHSTTRGSWEPAAFNLVRGRVRGWPPPGATVEAVLLTLSEGTLGEQVLGRSAINASGWFRIKYPRPETTDEPADRSLVLRLRDPQGELLAESPPLLGPPTSARVVLRMPRRPRPAEYTLLEQRVAGELDAGLAGLDGLSRELVAEVANWLDVPADRLALLQRARALEAETAVPAPVYYGLGRSGLRLTLEELVDIPLDALRLTVEEAVADGVAPEALLVELPGLVERLAECAVERAVAPIELRETAGLPEILGAADLGAEDVRQILRRFQRRQGDDASFREAFAEAAGEGEDLAEAVRLEASLAMDLSSLLGPDPVLLRRMHELRREGRWGALDDLTAFDRDDWCRILGELDGQPEQDLDEASREGIEARADVILDALEQEFPSVFLRRAVLQSEQTPPGVRQLLERLPDHDFHAGSVREHLVQEPALLEGLPEPDRERAVEEIEAFERVSRLTDRADEVAVLVETGMRSAMEIAGISRNTFIQTYAEALGGRAQAARIHAESQRAAAASKLAMVRLLQAHQQNPAVITGPIDQLKQLPDARELFGSSSLCGCEHCGSVYSPAAYLVDLLRYLDVDVERLKQLRANLAARGTPSRDTPAAGLHKPLDVLLARRPDLAEIQLTCENTLTPLPYIDLVNELLEARVAGGSAAHETGKTPPDVLRAVPQNSSAAAYLQLQQAVHPIGLPYHQPLAVARAYLGHLGVSRHQLVRTLAREPAGEAALAEWLGMSPEELGHIVRTPQELWRHLGFPAEQVPGGPGGQQRFIEALAAGPVFLEATGISYRELIELASCRFVNADGRMTLDLPGADCDPDKVQIGGLDDVRLSRVVRLLRLHRRLGWTLPNLDRALFVLQAGDLDTAVLEKLAEMRDVARLLDRSVPELLVLWGSLDTWGTDNQFDRLLNTRAVAWRAGDADAFQLGPDRTELASAGTRSLDDVAAGLLAGFRSTSDELAAIRDILTRRGAPPRVDLAGLSAIYRVVVLARALRLRITQLDALLRLVPESANPFRPAEPAATRRFVEVVREVQASDFAPERLAYLFRHEEEPRRSPAPLPAQVEGVLASIRRALVDAFTETSHSGDAIGETLRGKLALVVDASLLDPAMEILDPRTSAPLARRREFFTQHLARIFPDAAAAARRLFEAPDDGADAASSPEPPAERRWRSNIRFVLEHLLPQLRTRQTRGAVVQTLADVLGLSAASTALLLERVLRSRRRPGEPLLADFLSLLGNGLTGAYFASADLTGDPAVTRLDPDLVFSWAGAPPAPGVPERGFSARWTGRFLPRSRAAHVFYARSDGAVRLTLTVDGKEKVLLDRTPEGGGVAEQASEPLLLDPRQLYELRLEYRNQGSASPVLSLQFGSAPGSKQPLSAADLFPSDGLTSLTAVADSYRRIHKASLLLTGFGTTDAQLDWLTGDPAYLDLNALPMEAGGGSDSVALFGRWRQLAALHELRRKLPRGPVDLFDVFRAGTLDEAISRLVLATGWDRAVVDGLIGPQGFAVDGLAGLRPPVDPTVEPLIVRLARAVELQRRLGASPATLFAWANATPDVAAAGAVVQAVKARYDEKPWLEVARNLNDPLRAERRDALVTYLLPRMREQGVKDRAQLFEYFLIDVDMSPCMLTSRIRQAIAAVQTFFQRCLMNLELQVNPRLIDDRDWKWMKNYRVWEANRKIFLYPENWIEPELRDDKSPLFVELERTILQQEIKAENVEAAFVDYLQGLDEIARLDVRAVCFERRPSSGRGNRKPPARGFPTEPRTTWNEGTYHIFGRTFNTPHVWYYRRLVDGRTWTPWEKVDGDIDSEHLVPVIYQRRLHLFWTVFREVTRQTLPPKKDKEGAAKPALKDWEISLAYSVRERETWSRKKLSSTGKVDQQDFVGHMGMRFEGTRWLEPRDYTLRAQVNGPHLDIHLYRRRLNTLRLGLLPPPLALEDAEVDKIGRFELDGCNGELVLIHDPTSAPVVVAPPSAPARRVHLRGLVGARRRPQPAPIVTAAAPGAFTLARGGRMSAPSGYRVDGVGFSPSLFQGGSLLAFGAGTASAGLALGAPRGNTRGVHLVPVLDPELPPERQGLYPFIYQDRFHSYFARPFFGRWHEPRLVAVPQRPSALLLSRHFAGKRPAPRALPASRGRGKREALANGEATLTVWQHDARDARENREDEAWHPDDAAERRAPRPSPAPAPRPGRPPDRRTGPPVARPARAPAPAAQFRLERKAGFHEERLRFVPFEHPATCRLMQDLRDHGIERLLALTTTRPPRLGPPRPGYFARTYRPGPLVDGERLPRLDVDFQPEHPYALYNWELFFHAPLQVAIRLAKDGRHEEAQRWFHFIFDPTTDVSAPAPQRYWRFAPFHENTEYAGARELTALLSYGGNDPGLIARREQVREQLDAWLEKPFSPHVIARLRIAAYQRAVVMKYIDNLIEWGDKLFRMDTMESIHEATQLYILAGNILGRRPERIPAMVATEPTSFAKVRARVNAFANWEVRFENRQVRRPFRITGRPDVAAATSVLTMATEYFCLPANPQMDKYWDTVADRLFKIRNCMNIQGVVRQLALFEPPLDPGMLVRAAAAGVDLGSVVARLNAPPPHHRFRPLAARAVQLTDEVRGFGQMTLQVLERRDAEGLAALRASGEATLLDLSRDIRKKQVRQVEEELAELSVEKEHVELQARHITTQMQELMNPQEAAAQAALTARQVIAGVAEGVDLVSKVLYAIPDFQAGTAGGFSSPFVTLQMGGQMFGDITAAVASSLEKVMSKSESDSALAEAQAEYQRRRAEWQNQLELLAKEKAQIEKRAGEVQLKLEICNAELRRHDQEVENARKVERYLRDKYTSEQLYGWMLGQVSGIYFQAYKLAFDAAQLAERAFRFERGEPSASFIEFSYWDSFRKGLLAGERLLQDLRRMESTYLEGDRRALEITRHLSLREDHPAALQELLATGRCKLDLSEALLDGDFPGHYFRRLKTVGLTMVGDLKPHDNVNCTLTLLANRLRTEPAAGGTYPEADDGEDPRFLVNLAPVQAVATSRPGPDAGLFTLRFDDERYLPFEGAGAISSWRIDLHQADNAVDLARLGDVVLNLSYTARLGGAALEAAARASREKALGRGGLTPPPRQLISLRRDVPDAWKRLSESTGQEISIPLPLDSDRLSGRFRGLAVRVEGVTAVAHARGTLADDGLRLRLEPPAGSGSALGGWTQPWSGSRALRATTDIQGPAGSWKLVVGAGAGKLPDLLEDLHLLFELRVRKP